MTRPASSSVSFRALLDAVADVAVRPGWHRQAACRGMGPALFFPAADGKRSPPPAAVLVCQGCEVVDECRQAGAGERWGVWAGQLHRPKRTARPHTPRRVADVGHAATQGVL